MKKVFSILALAAMTLSLSSFNSVGQNSSKSEVNYGNPTDCARMARATVLKLADEFNTDPNGLYFDYYIRLYNHLYEGCYNS